MSDWFKKGFIDEVKGALNRYNGSGGSTGGGTIDTSAIEKLLENKLDNPITPEFVPLKVGDKLGDTIYFDTSRNIDEWLSGLDYMGDPSSYDDDNVNTPILVKIGEELGPLLSILDYGSMSGVGHGEYGYVVMCLNAPLYISANVPDEALSQMGLTHRGWLATQLPNPLAELGADIEIVSVADGCDFVSNEPVPSASGLVEVDEAGVCKYLDKQGFITNILKQTSDLLPKTVIISCLGMQNNNNEIDITEEEYMALRSGNVKLRVDNVYDSNALDGVMLYPNTYYHGDPILSYNAYCGFIDDYVDDKKVLRKITASVSRSGSDRYWIKITKEDVNAGGSGGLTIIEKETGDTFVDEAVGLIGYNVNFTQEEFDSLNVNTVIKINVDGQVCYLTFVTEIQSIKMFMNASGLVLTVYSPSIGVPGLLTIAHIPSTSDSNEWTGSNNFTGDLKKNGEDVATIDDIIVYKDELSDYSEASVVNEIVPMAEGTYSEGLLYVLLDDGTYEVRGIGSCTDTEIVIPSSYEGIPVTSIGSKAFDAKSTITSVVIPEGVKYIRWAAFRNCTNLASINIPSTAIEVDFCWDSFSGTKYYNTSSNWENDVLYIDGWLVCAKTSVSGDYTVKEGTKGIGNYAFASSSANTSLRTAIMPEGLKYIGAMAFFRCTGLTSVANLPNSLITIGNSAFSQCTGIVNVVIPDRVKRIGESAFFNCTSLQSVTIGARVTEIGFGAFNQCSSMNTVTFKTMNGWEVGSSNKPFAKGEGAFVYVGDSSQNATNLSTTYNTVYWMCFGVSVEADHQIICVKGDGFYMLYEDLNGVKSYKKVLTDIDSAEGGSY